MANEDKDDKKGKTAGRGKWTAYTTEGEFKRERKSCPKCGAGVFMAQHEDRLSCGKCGYTEFTREKIIHVFPEHRKAQAAKEKERAEEEKEEEEEEEGEE